ncbi:MAG: 1,5-anhydro-D-fructose reductase [Planctomycetota bacterium]|jgi:predicted dehydrogenase
MSSINQKKRLRWAILGCARISRRGLIPGIQLSHSGTLDLLASRRPEVGREWATEFHIPRTTESYESAISDPNIDCVYIPLANEEHAPYVKMAADAGKHILCEKPLALNADEARHMAGYCREKGVILMEAFMWRHQPRVKALREQVQNGRIGELKIVRSSFSFPIDMSDWRLDPTRGGGALWDIGCYCISAIRLFSGSEPVDIRGRARFSDRGVDLSMGVSVKCANGILGVFDCSFELPFRMEYELVGSNGFIQVPIAFLPTDAPQARFFDIDGNLVEEVTYDGRNQYACMVDNFAASVENGQLVEPSEDGVSQMIALDQVLAACR